MQFPVPSQAVASGTFQQDASREFSTGYQGSILFIKYQAIRHFPLQDFVMTIVLWLVWLRLTGIFVFKDIFIYMLDYIWLDLYNNVVIVSRLNKCIHSILFYNYNRAVYKLKFKYLAILKNTQPIEKWLLILQSRFFHV